MGASGSKHEIKKDELKKLVEDSHFDVAELQALYDHFKGISSSRADDGVIDRKEFQSALGLRDSLFVERMFALFDKNGDGNIDFREFITGLSVFCKKGTLDEKLKFSFRIYDFDNDGCITKDELYKLLQASLFENHLNLSPEQLQSLVDATFKEADLNGDGRIDFTEYKALVAKHPGMLNNMTVNVGGLAAAVQPGAAAPSSSK